MSILDDRFSSDDFRLDKLLDDMEEGHLQIPKFQRDLVWDKNDIHALLVSISLAYPIGALLLLKTKGGDVRFEPRSIDPLSDAQKSNAAYFVLDGQQRLTALYMALRAKHTEKALEQKGKRAPYIYYLDVQKSLETSREREEEYREGAIIPVKLTKSNWDPVRAFVEDNPLNAQEYKVGRFPLHLLFDDRRVDWLKGYKEYLMSLPDNSGEEEVDNKIERFKKDVLKNFQMYELPAIVISEDAKWGTVCRMFEKINSTGKKLNAFDLLGAKYAAQNEDLQKDMNKKLGRLHTCKALAGIGRIDFLRAVTLVARCQTDGLGGTPDGKPMSCTNDAVLKLPVEEYRMLGPEVENAFVHVGHWLEENCIWNKESVPFRTQLITFAAILAHMSDYDDADMWLKLKRWYWCSVFAGTYGSSTNEQCAQDMVRLQAWLRDGERQTSQLPKGISEARFDAATFLRRFDRKEAVFKGIAALMRIHGDIDLVSGDPLSKIVKQPNTQVVLHHFFPKQYCRDTMRKVDFWDSVVNLVPISGASNGELGSKSPSEQLEHIREKHAVSDSDIVSRLAFFGIGIDTVDGRDDFEAFFVRRSEQVSQLIATAIGRDVENLEDVREAAKNIEEHDPHKHER